MLRPLQNSGLPHCGQLMSTCCSAVRRWRRQAAQTEALQSVQARSREVLALPQEQQLWLSGSCACPVSCLRSATCVAEGPFAEGSLAEGTLEEHSPCAALPPASPYLWLLLQRPRVSRFETNAREAAPVTSEARVAKAPMSTEACAPRTPGTAERFSHASPAAKSSRSSAALRRASPQLGHLGSSASLCLAQVRHTLALQSGQTWLIAEEATWQK
mmetsp:Transcript_46538/g.129480  ORF Transcript_46538/g.129480 Transcript_46538/m.129480 type:complete len:215 (+) Transcript_46538:471-1115(+)